MGIAPRRLWGWEPKVKTKHVYENGVLVKTTSRQEPEWDAESYELVAALAVLESERHPCGHPISEALSFEANPDNKEGTIRYVADDPSLCFACDALEKKKNEFSGDNFNPARQFTVRREDR